MSDIKAKITVPEGMTFRIQNSFSSILNTITPDWLGVYTKAEVDALIANIGGMPNLGNNPSPTDVEITSSTGASTTIPQAVASGDAGVMSGADKQKLDDIEQGAEVNQTNAEIVTQIDTQLGNTDWQSGGGGNLLAEIDPTISVGGVNSNDPPYAVGTGFEQIIRDMLSPYVKSSLNSATLSPGTSVFEVGATYDPASIQLNYSNDSNGNPPINVVVTGVGFSNTPRVLDGSSLDVFANDNADTVTKTDNTSETWTISATDALGGSISSRSDTVNWLWRWTFGASAIDVIDNATAQTVYDAQQQTELRPGRSNDVDCTADNENVANLTYIMYAAEFGDLTSIIQDGALPVLTAFTKLGDFTIANAQGVPVDYRVYKSNSTGAFADGTHLSIG